MFLTSSQYMNVGKNRQRFLQRMGKEKPMEDTGVRVSKSIRKPK